MKLYIYNKFFNVSNKFIILYGKSKAASSYPKPLCYFREYYRFKMIRKFSCHISPKSTIHKTTKFPHPSNIVIGDGVSIGENSIVYQGVTIGAGKIGDGRKNLYPKIGKNVTIYSGAVIVGDISIGDNAVIGANAFVNKDVPPNCIAIGVPALVKEVL